MYGAFRFDRLPGGAYRLRHQWKASNGTARWAVRRLSLAPAADQWFDVVSLSSTVFLQGRIFDARRRALAGVSIVFRPKFQSEYVEFGAVSDADGRYEVENLMPGAYAVEMTLRDPLGIERRSGPQTVEIPEAKIQNFDFHRI